MLVIVITSIIIYLVAAVIIYHNINKFEKQQKIKYILVGMLAVTLFTTIICSITTAKIDIENKQIIGITRITEILIFSPINSIIWLPFIGSSLGKYKLKEINDAKLKKRAIIEIILIIITLIIEIGYIENFQVELLKLEV